MNLYNWPIIGKMRQKSAKKFGTETTMRLMHHGAATNLKVAHEEMKRHDKFSDPFSYYFWLGSIECAIKEGGADELNKSVLLNDGWFYSWLNKEWLPVTSQLLAFSVVVSDIDYIPHYDERLSPNEKFLVAKFMDEAKALKDNDSKGYGIVTGLLRDIDSVRYINNTKIVYKGFAIDVSNRHFDSIHNFLFGIVDTARILEDKRKEKFQFDAVYDLVHDVETG